MRDIYVTIEAPDSPTIITIEAPASPIVVTIPQGAPGARGNSVLNGTIPPASNIGTNGDFYVDTVARFFYGPKVGGTWPAGFALGSTGPAPESPLLNFSLSQNSQYIPIFN